MGIFSPLSTMGAIGGKIRGLLPSLHGVEVSTGPKNQSLYTFNDIGHQASDCTRLCLCKFLHACLLRSCLLLSFCVFVPTEHQLLT